MQQMYRFIFVNDPNSALQNLGFYKNPDPVQIAQNRTLATYWMTREQSRPFRFLNDDIEVSFLVLFFLQIIPIAISG